MTQDKTFTIDQIQEAYKKVKSGADFPKLIQDLKAIGVTHYEHNVADGQTIFFGAKDYAVKSAAKYPIISIGNIVSTDKLKHALSIHQKGKTDYLTFCRHSADAGVEKWTTDMKEMTVIYFDRQGNKLIFEPIPKP